MKLLVSVPASIANLGSGFDTFGLAIDLRNEVEIEDAKEFSLIEEGVKFEGEDLRIFHKYLTMMPSIDVFL